MQLGARSLWRLFHCFFPLNSNPDEAEPLTGPSPSRWWTHLARLPAPPALGFLAEADAFEPAPRPPRPPAAQVPPPPRTLLGAPHGAHPWAASVVAAGNKLPRIASHIAQRMVDAALMSVQHAHAHSELAGALIAIDFH